MLFAHERLNFFRPLTGKYREQVVACLRSLYARLYSSLADYSRVVQRDLVIEVFQEAFSEHSVVKYREELDELLRRARAQRWDAKAAVEPELRRLTPELVGDGRRSVYMTILDQIESRLHSAADVMLPALSQSLHGFTRRADILLRQLSFTEASQHALLEAFERLAAVSEEEQDVHLAAAGQELPPSAGRYKARAVVRDRQ